MRPWYWTAAGVAAMVYLAWHGGYESAGWWVAALLMGLMSILTWIIEWQQHRIEEQHGTIKDLLQIMQDREELNDAKVGAIADLAGVGPSWRAHWAIATARVQAKREKGVKND